jgi:DNA-directed RNA polymerase subunit RPC12/RpoP
MNLFTDLKCAYCQKEFVPSQKNPYIASGFRDQDTGQHVCTNCKTKHYQQKALNGMAGLYSEVPFLLNQSN